MRHCFFATANMVEGLLIQFNYWHTRKVSLKILKTFSSTVNFDNIHGTKIEGKYILAVERCVILWGRWRQTTICGISQKKTKSSWEYSKHRFHAWQLTATHWKRCQWLWSPLIWRWHSCSNERCFWVAFVMVALNPVSLEVNRTQKRQTLTYFSHQPIGAI